MSEENKGKEISKNGRREALKRMAKIGLGVTGIAILPFDELNPVIKVANQSYYSSYGDHKSYRSHQSYLSHKSHSSYLSQSIYSSYTSYGSHSSYSSQIDQRQLKLPFDDN